MYLFYKVDHLAIIDADYIYYIYSIYFSTK